MACPYCSSKKIENEINVRRFNLNGEFITIDHVECSKCGGYYTRTIRINPATGNRKTIISKGSPIPGAVSVSKKKTLREKLRARKAKKQKQKENRKGRR